MHTTVSVHIDFKIKDHVIMPINSGIWLSQPKIHPTVCNQEGW